MSTPPRDKRSLPPLGVAMRHHLPLFAMLMVAGVIVVGVAVLPMRTWFQQRELISETEVERLQIVGEVAQLEAELEMLQTDEEVERLGRENFDLVKPGEESYRILPSVGS